MGMGVEEWVLGSTARVKFNPGDYA
jgi:hypothetical protein